MPAKTWYNDSTMKIQENVQLDNLTTMRLSGVARYLIELKRTDDIPMAIKFAKNKTLPWFVLGGGSNVIARDFNGIILLNRIHDFQEVCSDEKSTTFKIGAGEIMDNIIAKTTARGMAEFEFLSLVPGTIGAAPVQNVGCYGMDISQILQELTAYNTETGKFEIMKNVDCHFGYRDSIFKSADMSKYIIADVTLRLLHQNERPPFYRSLQQYILNKHPELALNETDFKSDVSFTPSEIRQSIIDVRNSKLPDPKEIPSAGSFFQNPVVSADFAKKLLEQNPTAPHFPTDNGQIKLAAGWLIDQAGLKGFSDRGFQIYPKNALVITNIAHDNSNENLMKFREKIVDSVHEKFGVTLQQEPINL